MAASTAAVAGRVAPPCWIAWRAAASAMATVAAAVAAAASAAGTRLLQWSGTSTLLMWTKTRRKAATGGSRRQSLCGCHPRRPCTAFEASPAPGATAQHDVLCQGCSPPSALPAQHHMRGGGVAGQAGAAGAPLPAGARKPSRTFLLRKAAEGQRRSKFSLELWSCLALLSHPAPHSRRAAGGAAGGVGKGDMALGVTLNRCTAVLRLAQCPIFHRFLPLRC